MEHWDVSAFLVWHLSMFWVVFCVGTIVVLLIRHVDRSRAPMQRIGTRGNAPRFTRVQLVFVALVAGGLYIADLLGASEARLFAGIPAAVLILAVASHFFLRFNQLRPGQRNSS